MSLPKTLKLAQDRLDEAEANLELHADELVETLTTEETEYRGLYQEKVVNSLVRAGTQVHNARHQFDDYEEDFEDLLEGEQTPEELVEDHDIAPNTEQYKQAYESAAQVTLRYRNLDRQIEAISRIMEQNGMEGLKSQVIEQHPWYNEPEDAEGFKKASSI